MRLPIQYALCYPERVANPELPVLDFSSLEQLTFEQPDSSKFPCLRLAVEAGRNGGTCPTVLCVADEAAVDLFLSGYIKFTDIACLVERVLGEHEKTVHPDIGEIIAAGDWARERVLELAGGDSR